MSKTPQSQLPKIDTQLGSNSPIGDAPQHPVDARVTDLDRRVAELSDRLATALGVNISVPSADAQLIEQQNEQIAELQRLVLNLGDRLTSVQAVNARDAEFKAVVKSVESAASALQRGLTPVSPAADRSDCSGAVPGHDCECEGCGCVSCACCTFEVWMSHVRVDQMQLPIDAGDSNALPTSVMEMWMFASIDPIHNLGVCIPDPSPLSYLPLHKQITEPFGPWVQVNRCIGTVAVKKGTPLVVPLSLTAVEREDALERTKPINRDEWGATTENLTLDCCYSNYSPVLISVPLTSWGQAGGAITGKFIVVKRC
jgi:hypothetical protein